MHYTSGTSEYQESLGDVVWDLVRQDGTHEGVLCEPFLALAVPRATLNVDWRVPASSPSYSFTPVIPAPRCVVLPVALRFIFPLSFYRIPNLVRIVVVSSRGALEKVRHSETVPSKFRYPHIENQYGTQILCATIT